MPSEARMGEHRMTTTRQVTSLTPTGLMPRCQQRFLGDRLTQLSTVHVREDQRSFYRDINGQPLGSDFGWRQVIEFGDPPGADHGNAVRVKDQPVGSESANADLRLSEAPELPGLAERESALTVATLALYVKVNLDDLSLSHGDPDVGIAC